MTIEERPKPTPRPRPVRPARSRPAAALVVDDETPVWARRLEGKIDTQGARLDALERGSGRLPTVEATPEPKPDTRVAEPLYDSPFLSKLLDQTRPTPTDYGGDTEPGFNVPPRLYMKPDGTIVSLQGDSKSRAYYQEKGFHLLDKAQTQHYLEVEKPKVVQAQRRKAHLINTIRNMFKREPSLIGWRDDPEYDNTLSLMSIDQLQDEWEDLRARSINPGQKLPAMPSFRSDEKPDAMLQGVDTTPKGIAAELVIPAMKPGRAVEVSQANYNQFR